MSKTTKTTATPKAPTKAGSKREEMLAENEKRATKKTNKTKKSAPSTIHPQPKPTAKKKASKAGAKQADRKITLRGAKAAIKAKLGKPKRQTTSKRRPNDTEQTTDRRDGTATQPDAITPPSKPSFFGRNPKTSAAPAPAKSTTTKPQTTLQRAMDAARAIWIAEPDAVVTRDAVSQQLGEGHGISNERIYEALAQLTRLGEATRTPGGRYVAALVR